MMEQPGQHVLITGGCGFIGSNLIEHLATAGYRLRVLDDLSIGQPSALAGYDVELIVGDVRDPIAARQAAAGVDAVVHLAAHTDVRHSVTHPEIDCDLNIQGLLTMLIAARDEGIKRFVFASSNAPLGEQNPPVREDQIPHPLSPYGASKLAGEAYCRAFYGSYGLPTVILRFANAYGPRSTHKSSVVAKFIRRVMQNEPLLIYGDGRQTRDFVYAGDLCQAIRLAIETDAAVDQIFQIGSGVETSVLEFVDLLKTVANRTDIRIDFAPPQPGEIRRNYSQIDKARQQLGYEAQTTLAEGLKATYDWFLRQNSG